MIKWLRKAGSASVSSITLTGLKFLFQTLGETDLRSLCVFNCKVSKAEFACNPPPATRYPLQVTRYPPPATCHLPPATSHPLPVTRYPSPAICHPTPVQKCCRREVASTTTSHWKAWKTNKQKKTGKDTSSNSTRHTTGMCKNTSNKPCT